MEISTIKWLTLLLLICAPATSRGQEAKLNPETIGLSRFTFTRPAGWTWDPRVSGKKKENDPEAPGVVEEVVFRIPGPISAPVLPSSHLILYSPKSPLGNAKATAKRWRGWFEDVRPSDPVTKSETIGSTKVTWLEFHGIYRAGNVNHTLMGAVIEDKKGNIVARMVGTAECVEENRQAFKNMIKGALKKN